jgi:ADP-dependent NAD(P)H-hydrate dehydratase / NAD(P)H-hydrate epimerase
MTHLPATHPILSCAEAGALEKKLFAGDEALEWAAMQRAGEGIARAVSDDAEEVGGLRPNGRVLVLVGKGHNGGDALIAAKRILEENAAAVADVIFVFGERSLRPLAAKAWRGLAHSAAGRVTIRTLPSLDVSYDVCIDGIFGFQFRPPADERVAALIDAVNASQIRMRIAVDLPSAGLFRADFTYTTGSVKEPVLESVAAGRVRYLDLGFFPGEVGGHDRVLTPGLLQPLAGFRSPQSDKRTFGHVAVVGGSRNFPGAILMTVLAALRSGAGLVTAFVPESVVAAFAARAPEAMWVGWPETPTGGLALAPRHS